MQNDSPLLTENKSLRAQLAYYKDQCAGYEKEIAELKAANSRTGRADTPSSPATADDLHPLADRQRRERRG